MAIEIDHHRGGALRRIEAHIVHIHLLLRGVKHKTAEGIVADAADKPAVTAEPRHTDRHVGRRAAGALQQAALPSGRRSTTASPSTQIFPFIRQAPLS